MINTDIVTVTKQEQGTKVLETKPPKYKTAAKKTPKFAPPEMKQQEQKLSEINQPEEKQSTIFGHCGIGKNNGLGNKNDHVFFKEGFNITGKPLAWWLEEPHTFCDGRITVYGDKFAIGSDVIVNPDRIQDLNKIAKGGEPVQSVPEQLDVNEIYTLQRGFYVIQCKNEYSAEGYAKRLAFERLKEIRFTRENHRAATIETVEKFTILVERGDYANFWNHVTEVFGVFLMLMTFRKQPNEVQIMIADGHPLCNLDRDWETLFGPLVRVGHLSKPAMFKQLVFGLNRKKIPLARWENATCSYVEEFRTFMLNQYGLSSTSKTKDCKRLTFTIIFRRNQVYHPRNMEGNVERKIFNELDIVEAIMNAFPGMCIQVMLMESIPVKAQLEIIGNTDVLVGMHGAALVHLVFLPPHAGLVELFPYMHKMTRIHGIMFEKMARWRNLQYASWEAEGPESFLNSGTTIVNAEQIVNQCKKVVEMMCAT